MEAYKYEDNYWLTFTTVLDETHLEMDDDDDEVKEVVDRTYWENRGTEETLAITDKLIQIIREFDEKYNLKYNKFYIGLEKNGHPDNFASFKPRKQNTILEVRLEQSNELDSLIESGGLDIDYKWGRYRIRLTDKDFNNNKELLTKLLRMASGRTPEPKAEN